MSCIPLVRNERTRLMNDATSPQGRTESAIAFLREGDFDLLRLNDLQPRHQYLIHTELLIEQKRAHQE